MSTNHNLFEEKGEPKRYRTEVLPLSQPNALPLGQTGSLTGERDAFRLYNDAMKQRQEGNDMKLKKKRFERSWAARTVQDVLHMHTFWGDLTPNGPRDGYQYSNA